MSEPDYSFLERLFHGVVLSSPAVSEAFFSIESSRYKNKANGATLGAPVFVSGLARSGTTVLMRMLHDTGAFAALTYRDMPLVMAPNSWRSFSKNFRKHTDRDERAHGDGLLVGFDSPEALEEVFWRTFCGNDYILRDRLQPMEASDEVIEFYRNYVRLIQLRYGRDRYLTKNNNSILRLPSLARAFSNATIIVPFRDPLTHAHSLWRQHSHFVSLHKRDRFTRKYMTWLGHHEFGTDHRRFVFSEDEVGSYDDMNSLQYWLDLWIDAHAFLLKQAEVLGDQVIFQSYESLTQNPHLVREQLFARLGLQVIGDLEIRDAPTYPDRSLDHLDIARSLYQELTEKNYTTD